MWPPEVTGQTEGPGCAFQRRASGQGPGPLSPQRIDYESGHLSLVRKIFMFLRYQNGIIYKKTKSSYNTNNYLNCRSPSLPVSQEFGVQHVQNPPKNYPLKMFTINAAHFFLRSLKDTHSTF